MENEVPKVPNVVVKAICHHEIVSECSLCSGKETWTGKTEEREGKTYYEMKCAGCGSVGFEWDKRWPEAPPEFPAGTVV